MDKQTTRIALLRHLTLATNIATTRLRLQDLPQNFKELAKVGEHKQNERKIIGRLRHASVRVRHDTRRVRYQVPARGIPSCCLLVSYRTLAMAFGSG